MKGNQMNYLAWSQEYTETAEELNKVILRLKKQRAGKGKSDKKEITDKISEYRCCRNDCLRIAEHLMQRHRGCA